MAFTDIEIAEHMKVIEDAFWSRRRPPVHLRDKVREGQRFTDRAIELFIVRPAFKRPGEEFEETHRQAPAPAPVAGLAHFLETGGWQVAPLPAISRGAIAGGSHPGGQSGRQRLFPGLNLSMPGSIPQPPFAWSAWFAVKNQHSSAVELGAPISQSARRAGGRRSVRVFRMFRG